MGAVEELDTVVEYVNQALQDIDEEIDRISTTPGINIEQEKQKIKADLALCKDQYTHYKQQLRLCSTAKNEAGEEIMNGETREKYNAYKKAWGSKFLSLETKIKNAQQTDRAELFSSGEGAAPPPDKPKEEWTAQELWTDTHETMDRSTALVDEALRTAEESREMAVSALEKQEQNRQKQIQIREACEELDESYQVSFGLMFQIMKGLACDQCFQILMGVLVLMIIGLLIANYV